MCQPNEVQFHSRASTLYDQLPSSSPVQGWRLCAGSWNAGHAQKTLNTKTEASAISALYLMGAQYRRRNRGWWRSLVIH
jgi:hypothetical protein